MQAASGGITNRALIPLGGRPMLDYVVEAAREGLSLHGAGGRILVAGEVPLPSGCVAVDGGESMIDTLLNGASALTPNEMRLLIVTADIPFVTGAALADFLERAEAVSPAAFVWPIVEASRCKAQFPGMRRTTLRLREGEFTGGNIALLDPAFLRERETLLRDAYARRKSVVGLARLLGPEVLFRLAVSRVAPGLLPIAFLEAAVGRVLGSVTVRAVVTPFAEIGTDVDNPEDVAFAEQIISEF